MKKHKKPKPELQNWYKDRYQHVVVQRKLLGFITLASLLCTLVSVIIVSQLIPQKSIEPYVIQIESKTGITQTVDPLSVKELTMNDTVNNFFLVMYLRAREGYSATDVIHQYNLVRLMSDERTIYPGFLAGADPNNKESNIARLGTQGTRTIKIKSITHIAAQTVQIRFSITESGEHIPMQEFHRIALVSFEYVKMNLTTEERYLNPLGFRVTAYQINEDVVPQ